MVVSPRGATRLRGGHPWVYRSDLIKEPAAPPGALVEVRDGRGKPIGSALYSSASQIALRLVSNEILDGKSLADLVAQRVRAAIAYRKRVVRDADAYRLVFSEADLLPGLIVDRYNDLLSLQVLTQAMELPEAAGRPLKEIALEVLQEELVPAVVVERVEPRIRELEQLPPAETRLLRGERSATQFTINGLKLNFDALGGQKTGAFLDQRENYAAAARYATGDALDVFCYQGGFALHLARVCKQVTGVDASRAALEVADQNAALNGMQVEWLEANAFDLMRDYADAGRKYDTIVLDPPAFAKSKKTLETALRGYKELNLRALKMLRPGGVLVTCSCSFHLSEAEFVQMLAGAASDAHRTLRILEKRGQSLDHPQVASIPETHYLKCVVAVAATSA